MRTRRLILVIAVYVGLDLTNPFMPGAFIFDPEQSVEGVQGERGRPQSVVLAIPAAPRIPPDGPPPAPRRPAPAATRKWFGEPRLSHLPATDPPPLADDH